jgi:hypothetical protein
MWCRWVVSFMGGGHVGIRINDTVSQNFQTKKRVRQEDHLSPILLNIVVDLLVILIDRAKVKGRCLGNTTFSR